jgi:NADH-quinone oxidoreductase subunit J
MFDIPTDAVPEGTEGFLVAFIVIALVLDAALDGAVMLARREEGESILELTDRGEEE